MNSTSLPPLIRQTLLLILATCWLTACDPNPGVVKREGEPNYVKAFDEETMERAIARARETHLDFVAALEAKAPKHSGFSIKKGYPVGAEQDAEHIWIDNVTWKDGVFEGTINNEPVDTKAVHLGQRVTVKPEEMSDWMYLDGQKVVGGYTLRVLLYQQSRAEREAFEKATGMIVPPIDF